MSKTPIVRPVSWLNTSINILILSCFLLIGWFLMPRIGLLIGAMAYLFLSACLRKILARHHRKAISFCKRQQFGLAIPEFEKSLEFFQENPWVDRFRAITMFSASGMDYREMDLICLGFCYGQLGDGGKSREYYEQCLREFPENGMAESALRLLEAGKTLRD